MHQNWQNVEKQIVMDNISFKMLQNGCFWKTGQWKRAKTYGFERFVIQNVEKTAVLEGFQIKLLKNNCFCNTPTSRCLKPNGV